MPGAGSDFSCERCYKRGFKCVRESDRYMTQLARKLGPMRSALRTGAPAPTPAPAPVPAPRLNRTFRAPLNSPAGSERLAPLSRPALDGRLDPPGPAYQLLVGGSTGHAGHDSAPNTALFWRSELSRAEGATQAARRHAAFVRSMYLESLEHCFVTAPSEDGSRSKRAKLSTSSSVGKGKGTAGQVEEGDFKGKGKDRAEPMDEDEDEVEDEDEADEDEDEDAAGDTD